MSPRLYYFMFNTRSKASGDRVLYCLPTDVNAGVILLYVMCNLLQLIYKYAIIDVVTCAMLSWMTLNQEDFDLLT